MRRPTLQQAINAGIFIPVGVLPGNIAGCAAIANLAMEQLIHDPLAPDEGWWGGWVSMLFNVGSGGGSTYITAPYDIARVIVMDICQKPIMLRNGFYEYLQFTAGIEPKNCASPKCGIMASQAYERDVVYTLNTFPLAPQLLHAFPTNSGDWGKRIVFQGPDQNGLDIVGIDTVTQSATEGETVYLQSPFTPSVNQFSGITGILKDPTLGPVQVYTSDPVSGATALLTTLQPSETTAAYRRYLINGLPCNCCNSGTPGIQVNTVCKLDFVPVVSGQDYLIIQSIPALAEQIQAIRYSRMDSPAAPALEAKHHAKALGLLFGQLDHTLGKVSTAINVPIFGSAKLRPQPV